MINIRKNGVWVDEWAEWAARKRVNGAWVDAVKDCHVRTPNISGTPPFTFKSDGENLRDWSMSGQTVQASTPTPSLPVAVNGVGEKTGNLFEGDLSQFDNQGGTGSTYQYFKLSGNFVITFTAKNACTAPNNTFMGITNNGGNASGGYSWGVEQGRIYSKDEVVTLKSSDNGYQFVSFYRGSENFDWILANFTIMLNTGSTAQSFEPFGYKIPVNVQSGNLWNEVFPEPSEYINKYIPIYVGDGDFTFSTNAGLFISQYAVYMFMAGRVTSGGSSANNGVSVGHPRTVTAINGYVTIVYHGYSGDYYPENFWGMLNTGTTPLPYQPYSNTTTNIYLGSVTSTRRVKKLVLDPAWTWVNSTSYPSVFRISLAAQKVTGLCTHYNVISASGYSSLHNNELSVWASQGSQLAVRDDRFTTPSDYKNWLQSQMDAGTPVVVYYIPITPETSAVNEPLMKIGSYVDEISKTGTGVNIPTTNGSNTLSVSTTVQPSGMTIQSISQWV